MQLIREFVDFDNLEIINEATEGKKKAYSIKGPFLIAENKNKNARKYRRPLLEREVAKLDKTKIKNKNAYGELDHPQSPIVSLKNASHRIESLVMDGDMAVGKAKLIDTPNGRIAEAILESGGRLMVSSRGIGTIDKESGYINDNFNLITDDLVSDGSFPECFVDGILEQKDWIIGNDGEIVEAAVEHLQEKVDKKFDSEVIKGYLLEFINEIKSKYI